jgi:hypothetical protein
VDWVTLAAGAIAGAIAGMILQNILFPHAQARLSARRRWRRYDAANKEWVVIQNRLERLQLVQAGWNENFCFADGSVVLRYSDTTFKQANMTVKGFRDGRSRDWLASGFKNGTQLGIANLSISRRSDSAEDERLGIAHSIVIDVHEYDYFDFLATHVLRLQGTPHEVAYLNDLTGRPRISRLTPGFPRRTRSLDAGGYWEPGKIFNAVGENLIERDFVANGRRQRDATVETLMSRGLREELGFTAEDIARSDLNVHSLAWASDLLDYKFFGYLRTDLSRDEITSRWTNAMDRAEGAPFFLPCATSQDHVDILESIRDEWDEWSPEAVFSTLRSLIVLQLVTPGQLRRVGLG